MHSKQTDLALLFIVPIIYGIALLFLFDLGWDKMFDMMSVTFFVVLPYGIGVISILMSDIIKVKKLYYRIFFPWLVLMVFLILTIIFQIEGWACWVMLFPIFGLAASVGGITAGYFKLNKLKRGQNMNVSLLVLLPLIFSPIEQSIVFEPEIVETNTEIVIHANGSDIWNNVTRVYQITKEEDSGYLSVFLGFPRPLRS